MNRTSALRKKMSALRMARHPSRGARRAARAGVWSPSRTQRYGGVMADSIRPLAPAPRPIRALVIGASGLVGGACFAALRERGHDVLGTYASHGAPGLVAFDFKQHLNLDRLVSGREVVVMASALTHVDFCETHIDEARARNVDDVERLAETCRR